METEIKEILQRIVLKTQQLLVEPEKKDEHIIGLKALNSILQSKISQAKSDAERKQFNKLLRISLEVISLV